MSARHCKMRGPAGQSRAFTLVELLVVIIIIAVLLVIAIPRYFAAVYTAEVRDCQSQIKVINTAAQAYFSRNRVWPARVEDMVRGTAPSWAVGLPLDQMPECPFGKPYHLAAQLQDGTTGVPTSGNPQVGVAVVTEEHFDGSWITATKHRE